MSKIKSSRTKPELKVKKLLKGLGFSYQPKGIFGRPDFANRKQKIVIFIDGCFWHGCKKHHVMPKQNEAYWKEKIIRNKKRDKEVTRQLKSEGWKVVRIWEHDL